MQVSGTLGDRAGLGPLKQALNAYALRHRAIASNIANAEVQGYQPRRVSFEDAARKAIGTEPGLAGYTTDPGHMQVGNGPSSPIEPRVVTEKPPSPGTPGARQGGVDLEKEMVSLVENQLSYRMATRLLDMKYNTLHKAIRGTSR